MIQKIIVIICDGCKGAIDYHPNSTKEDAIQTAKKDGIIFYKGRHFCDNKCKEEWKKNHQSGRGKC